MYPGYSPADHEYGKAAEEYGKAAAEARARGIELKHPEAEYEIGQAKGVKRKTLAGIREAQAAKGKGSGSGSGSGTNSGSEGPLKQELKKPATSKLSTLRSTRKQRTNMTARCLKARTQRKSRRKTYLNKSMRG